MNSLPLNELPALPTSSIYLNTATALSRYSQKDLEAYLTRIQFANSDLSPSLSLLNSLIHAHITTVPYDSSSLHVPTTNWGNPAKQNEKITLGGAKVNGKEGNGMLFGEGSFERIVHQNRGGYCYASNGAFATLLRSLGYQVSEVGARVFLPRGKDPAVTGYSWSQLTHETLIVNWGESKRYLVDVGFGGGGSTFAIELPTQEDEKTTFSPSITRGEAFKVTAELIPVDREHNKLMPDSYPGFTFSRLVTDDKNHYWSPCYHFTLSTLSPSDIEMANFFNDNAPNAPFMNFFAVSKLLPSGIRKTLAFGRVVGDTSISLVEEPRAKLYTKEGILGPEENVEYIPFRIGAIRVALEREFGFKF